MTNKNNNPVKTVAKSERWLIILDLDGTTLKNDGISIHPFNIQIIRILQSMGHIVCIITGRAPRASERFYWSLGMKSYLGTYNGSLILNPSQPKENRICTGIDTETAQKIISNNFLQQYSRSILIEINDTPYITKLTQEMYEECHVQDSIYGAHFIKPTEFKIHEEANAILIETLDHIPVEVYLQHLEILKEDITYRIWPKKGVKSVIIDISNKNATKAKCGEFLANYYKIPEDRIICFGDGSNDYEMFEWCKHPVRMLNHSPSLAKFKKYETKHSNENAGVGIYLNKFFKLNVSFFNKTKF